MAAGLCRVIPSRDEEDVHVARRAPIIFCLTPPIGSTAPSSSISPVAATL